jgi:hypothetical protein
MEKLFCPKCKENIVPIAIEVLPQSRHSPAEYEEGCPKCGYTELWEAVEENEDGEVEVTEELKEAIRRWG